MEERLRWLNVVLEEYLPKGITDEALACPRCDNTVDSAGANEVKLLANILGLR